MAEPNRAELEGLIDDLRRGYDGEPWHGPSLRKVLEGVTAEAADARPVPGGHTIRELVAHLAAWDDVVARRIAERRAMEEPDVGDFPAVVGAGPEAWAADFRELDARHAALLDVLADLDPARLPETVAGKDYSIAHMVRGAAQHMAYHAAQIGLLKKLM
ncbi:DinB family protein [Paludisphaera mucosa]|uniref:DinB family protein n=1 Tax=Paludisphaera mucosa TaxID=3030827 RepID=A0ABT6FC25_9BACT|nr:DinB family protein [Paludisphaera mucosa]MDG3005066.1 DinB family protein [Paludisphaera mucosa]